RIGRIDPAGGILTVDEISSAGVELDVAMQPDGVIDALGLRFGPAPQSTPSPQAQPPEPAAADQPAPPAAVTSTETADVATLVTDARRALPLLIVGTLDLKLDRLRIRGLGGVEAAPVDLAGVRLYNTGPVELAGENPDQRPPLKLQI